MNTVTISSRRHAPRIAVTNTVALNGGDAAIAIAIVESVLRAAPYARIELHDSQPAAAARYHPSLRWRSSLAKIAQLGPSRRRGARVLTPLNEARLLGAAQLWRRRATRPLAAGLLREGERRQIADFAGIDLVVSTGGTYLVEHYDIGARIFELQMARALGVPVVFYTQSLGPFRVRRHRRLLRKVFAASPLVLLRDERSRRNLRDLGVPGTALHVVADAVFGRENALPFAEPDGTPVRSVAVSVREWPLGADASDPAMVAFRRAVAASVSWLVRQHSASVTFLSTCQGVPEYWTDDSAVAEAVAAELPEDVRPRVQVDREFHAPDALADAYAHFDMVLATRMHAAILALTAGTPVLPVAYEFKTTELFQALGLGDYVVAIDGIDEDRLLERIHAFLADLPAVIRTLRPGVEAQRAQARRAEELLAHVAQRVTARR
jgi:colanic acid/amylovoran biosynthesis protein